MPFFIPLLIGLVAGSAATYAGYKTAEKASKAASEPAEGQNKVINNYYLTDSGRNPPLNQGKRANNIIKPPEEKLKDSSTLTLPDDTYQAIEEQLSKIENRLDKREKVALLDQIKTATPEEREALKKELMAQTRAECEATNKALQEQLEKQEKRNIELAQELQQAKEENNPTKIAKVMSMMKDNDKNQQATRLAIKKMMEEKSRQERAINEYVQNVDKPWYSDMNFSSPLLWIILIAALAIGIAIWWAIKWIFSKFKGAVSNE